MIVLLAFASLLLNVLSVNAQSNFIQPGGSLYLDLYQNVTQNPLSMMCINGTIMNYFGIMNLETSSSYTAFISCDGNQNVTLSGTPVYSNQGMCPNGSVAVGAKINDLSSLINLDEYQLYVMAPSFQNDHVQFICQSFSETFNVIETFYLTPNNAATCILETDVIQSYDQNGVAFCASYSLPYWNQDIGICPYGIFSSDGYNVHCLNNATFGAGTGIDFNVAGVGELADTGSEKYLIRTGPQNYSFCGVQKDDNFIASNHYSFQNLLTDLFNGALLPVFCPATNITSGTNSGLIQINETNTNMPFTCPDNSVLVEFFITYDSNNVITAYSYVCSSVTFAVDTRTLWPPAYSMPDGQFALMLTNSETVLDVIPVGIVSELRMIMNGQSDLLSQLWQVYSTDAFGCSQLQNVESGKFLSCFDNGCNQTDIGDLFRMHFETTVSSSGIVNTNYNVLKLAKCNGSQLCHLTQTIYEVDNYYQPRINGTMGDRVAWNAITSTSKATTTSSSTTPSISTSTTTSSSTTPSISTTTSSSTTPSTTTTTATTPSTTTTTTTTPSTTTTTPSTTATTTTTATTPSSSSSTPASTSTIIHATTTPSSLPFDARSLWPPAVSMPNEPFALMMSKTKTVFDVFSAGLSSGLRIIMNGAKAPPSDPSNQLWRVNSTDAFGCSLLQSVRSSKFLSCSNNACNQTDVGLANGFRVQNQTVAISGSLIYNVTKLAMCNGTQLLYLTETIYSVNNYYEPRINGTIGDGVTWIAMPGVQFPSQAFYIANMAGLVISGNNSLSLAANASSTSQLFVSLGRDLDGCSLLQSANANSYLSCGNSCTRVSNVTAATRFRRNFDTGAIVTCPYGAYLTSTNNTLYLSQSVIQSWNLTLASQTLINQAATEKAASV